MRNDRNSKEDSLKHLFAEIGNFGDNSRLQAEWSKYLCVLVSGFLETSIATIYTNYAVKKSAPNFATFVETKLRNSTNYKFNKIVVLARSFNKDWAKELEELDPETKANINTLLDKRNAIAHGSFATLSYIDVQNYYKSVRYILDVLEKQCNR